MRGVYFIANDAVLEQAIAFLNSFRLHNPHYPLCLIPFNDSYKCLEQLRDEYEFDIYKDDAVLAMCDAISQQFHDGRVLGHYRKLATWEGPFEEFIYIDVDTVVVKSVDFAFRLLSEYSFIFTHSNVEGTRKWVWKDSIDTDTTLTEEQKSFAANTGFICSKKGAMSLLKAKAAMPGALAIIEHMELWCIDQGFLNYLVVTSGLPYTSLFARFRAGSRDVYLEHWAGAPATTLAGSVVVPPYIFLVHWAGEWERMKVYRNLRNAAIWTHYRFLRKLPEYKL